METDSWIALPGPRLEMADYILNAMLVHAGLISSVSRSCRKKLLDKQNQAWLCA